MKKNLYYFGITLLIPILLSFNVVAQTAPEIGFSGANGNTLNFWVRMPSGFSSLYRLESVQYNYRVLRGGLAGAGGGSSTIWYNPTPGAVYTFSVNVLPGTTLEAWAISNFRPTVGGNVISYESGRVQGNSPDCAFSPPGDLRVDWVANGCAGVSSPGSQGIPHRVQWKTRAATTWNTSGPTQDAAFGICNLRGGRIYRVRYRYDFCGRFYYSNVQEFRTPVGGGFRNSANNSLSNEELADTKPNNIDEPQLKVKVFPNPAKNQISITFRASNSAKATISIYDVSGKLMKFEELKVSAGVNTRTIDISNFSKGLYFVQFKNDKEVKTEKLVVE